MATKPSRTQGKRLFNIMNQARGIIAFGEPKEDTSVTKAFGSKELIAQDLKSKILQQGFAQEAQFRHHSGRQHPANSLVSMMTRTYKDVGQTRLENKRILELMPEVAKAARLMVASIFAPNDLSRGDISITFSVDGLDEDATKELNKTASEFFQKHLKLKTAAPKWVYQFGYESGASIFAVVPLQTFANLQDESVVGTEAYCQQLDTIASESLFGFGDTPLRSGGKFNIDDVTGLESFTGDAIKDAFDKKDLDAGDNNARTLVEKFLATEALGLSDNPSILNVSAFAQIKRDKRNKNKINQRFKMPLEEPILELSAADDELGDTPMLLRLPPESVTVIHTPGEPQDHQGYLVLLDVSGHPLNAATMERDNENANNLFNKSNSGNIFTDVHRAYGQTTQGTNTQQMERQTMELIYAKVITKHLEKRLGKAGYNGMEMSNLNATMRCLFSRLLSEKRTRVLFLPKELVSYMTFETDDRGYGMSKLEGIKFSLGMKMALQISRLMAAIKAAMDKRNISIKFDQNMMEQPETVIENLIQQWIQKSSFSLSTDPGFIQSQIASKAVTVKTEGIPGMETFSIDNVADAGSSARDFDPTMMDDLNSTIQNGTGIPAAAMNALNENEYSRSVTTTNLFFSMEVSLLQDTVIHCISDLLRKYGRYSKAFQEELIKLYPELKTAKKKTTKNKSSTDETTPDGDDKDNRLPEGCTFETLLAGMSIALPKSNIAPSKAQFESFDAMTTSVNQIMTSIFPDELAGSDDKLRPIVGLMRARFAAMNIGNYLETSGMSGIELPEHNFSNQLKAISELHSGLHNVLAMLEDKTKLIAPSDPLEDPTATPPIAGY